MSISPSCPGSAAELVIAQTRRWLETAVIGLNLCPFAKAVHVHDQVGYRVSEATSPAELADDLKRELRALAAADPAALDTVLLIHPSVLTDFDDYNAFLAQADRVVRKLRLEGELQVASFHPDYQFADTAPDDVDNATNRSPYPMLHLLREDSIARAVAAYPDPERIYARNIASLRKLGWTGWQALAETWSADGRRPWITYPQSLWTSLGIRLGRLKKALSAQILSARDQKAGSVAPPPPPSAGTAPCATGRHFWKAIMQSPKSGADDAVIALATKLFNFARQGDTESLTAYIASGAPPNLTNDKGDSLLMLAAYHGHVETVRTLLIQGADANRVNDRGQSPLAGAVFKGYGEVVEALMAGGADPDYGRPSARDTATMLGRNEMLPLLERPARKG